MDLIFRLPYANKQDAADSPITPRYSAEDYDELSSDSEDEYCYDSDGDKDSKKKGRKPSGRIPKRPILQEKKK